MKTKQELIVLYLDWLNNDLTFLKFAMYKGLTENEALIMLDAGKKLNEI